LTGLPIKPASCAGFLLLAVASAVGAQDYVDVEAERRAAARAELDSPTAVAEPPAYSAIKPYAGSTTLAQTPVEATVEPITGSDSGSLVLRVQQLEADVRRLTGLLEEATQALRALESQSLERYVDLDRRIANGGGAPLAIASDTGPAVTAAAVNTDAAVGSGRTVEAQVGEEAAYRAAYELVRDKAFAEAVDAFTVFLADFPFGRYAPNAHYWLGELYLVIDPPDPELARQNFKLLLDQYPADPKVPDALYKLGRVQFIKGNRQRSREYLDEVIREFPSHAAAQLARQFLLENF